ncbi:hypothetical protein PMG11_00891 [Penicillium brasilianum]|uniref:GPI anchored protein n=1 Tax=Penicillium brasilianum TaxID=104259 RepID=A0A0F7TFB0_PENBI|nr:hypothetical protein PMG11_00891 [Penicillium brasilianum]
MQFKILAALLFSATALAAPQATGTSSSSSDESDLLDSVPNSILTVIATAVPATWLSEYMDPVSRSSMMSEIAAGTLPAWYNSLPSSVKAWATSAFLVDASATAVTGTDAATGTAVSVATATDSAGSSGSTTGSADSSSAAVSSAISSATSAASSKAASASSAHASATSTGGASVATGGVALSMAGAAGILGLALAL